MPSVSNTPRWFCMFVCSKAMFGESAGPVLQDAEQNQPLIEADGREAAALADQIGAGEGREDAARRGSSDGDGESAGESGGAAEQERAAAEHEHQQ